MGNCKAAVGAFCYLFFCFFFFFFFVFVFQRGIIYICKFLFASFEWKQKLKMCVLPF